MRKIFYGAALIVIVGQVGKDKTSRIKINSTVKIYKYPSDVKKLAKVAEIYSIGNLS